MKIFDLKVGFSCNNDCIHCVVADKRTTKDQTTQEIKDLISELEGDYMIGFTGGEPTIRKDFIDLVKHAKSKGFKTSVQTNGTMFSKDNFAEEISHYIDNVLIAIHSHRPDVHNEIVNCRAEQNMYEMTIQGFKNLVKYGIDHNTQTVISALNVEELVDTYDFIQGISPGVKMNMTYPHLMGNAYTNHEVVGPRYSDIKPYLHAALDKWAPLLRTEAIPMCYLYPYHDKVSANADRTIVTGERSNNCGIDPANKNTNKGGHFDERGITEDYGAADKSEKRKARLCRECIFDKECAGVWKEYIEFYRYNLDLFPIKKG